MNEQLPHEQVVIKRGPRSDLTIIVAIHSTVLGTAAGGCRLWPYASWRDGLTDALRLSEAMTLKCAVAGLPHGGGKTVIPLPEGLVLTPERRRNVMLDLGDLVESFGGAYGVGEDVGTTAADMLVAREQTAYAYCLPETAGGSGEPAEPTSVGVFEAIQATCAHLFGDASPRDRTFTIVGLGQVGGRVARRLAAEGARLQVTDIDPSRKTLADDLGATWIDLETSMTAETDILVPAALGGCLTYDLVPDLHCRAIVGPANNQLADDGVSDAIDGRGILWLPDFLVNAGGVISGALTDIHGVPAEEALERVRHIGVTTTEVLESAAAQGTTPHRAALALAHARLTPTPQM